MRLRVMWLLGAVLATSPIDSWAQARAMVGTWEVETPEGPITLMVRSDSTATFGEESVRWRVASDTIYIQFGEEWVGYNFELTDDSLTIWGGDLEDPVILKRAAPPSSAKRSALALGAIALIRPRNVARRLS